MTIINFLKRMNAKKQHEKCKRMNSEILCAIVHQVRKEQEKETVSIPAFIEVQSRYDSLEIKSYQDVIRAYKLFYSKGLVSGIEI